MKEDGEEKREGKNNASWIAAKILEIQGRLKGRVTARLIEPILGYEIEKHNDDVGKGNAKGLLAPPSLCSINRVMRGERVPLPGSDRWSATKTWTYGHVEVDKAKRLDKREVGSNRAVQVAHAVRDGKKTRREIGAMMDPPITSDQIHTTVWGQNAKMKSRGKPPVFEIHKGRPSYVSLTDAGKDFFFGDGEKKAPVQLDLDIGDNGADGPSEKKVPGRSLVTDKETCARLAFQKHHQLKGAVSSFRLVFEAFREDVESQLEEIDGLLKRAFGEDKLSQFVDLGKEFEGISG